MCLLQCLRTPRLRQKNAPTGRFWLGGDAIILPEAA